jgi:undecaprenyl-diphosphatase
MGGRLGASASPVTRLLAAGGRRVTAADRAVYAAVASSATPWLDEPARRLSQAANFSCIWIAIAAGCAVIGGPDGRRAAVRGLLAVGVTSATVNLLVKSLHPRQRPDRPGSRVPVSRQVTMPSSASFPSGHAAAGFAFACSAGHCLPRMGAPLVALAAAVGCSRVYTGVHFPADVVVGSAIGAAIGRAVTRIA